MTHTAAISGTVGEWTSRGLRAVLVIEKYGIDFHKEDGLPLEDACRARALDATQVAAEIEAATAPRLPDQRDWAAAPLCELIDHILARHHEYLKLELPRLRARLDRMAKNHGERDGQLLSRLHEVYVALQDELDAHLRKEEVILFPLVQRYLQAKESGEDAMAGGIRGPIFVMEREHDHAIQALRKMREITRDYVPAEYACANFRAVFKSLEELEADLQEHIRLENNILFQRAEVLERELMP